MVADAGAATIKASADAATAKRIFIVKALQRTLSLDLETGPSPGKFLRRSCFFSVEN